MISTIKRINWIFADLSVRKKLHCLPGAETRGRLLEACSHFSYMNKVAVFHGKSLDIKPSWNDYEFQKPQIQIWKIQFSYIFLTIELRLCLKYLFFYLVIEILSSISRYIQSFLDKFNQHRFKMGGNSRFSGFWLAGPGEELRQHQAVGQRGSRSIAILGFPWHSTNT